MDTKSSITMTEGYLAITDVYGQPHLVEEVSMARYEQFFRLWHLGIAAGIEENPTGTFTYNWVWCSRFREAMEKALLVFGLKADDLNPSQIRMLLLGEGGDKPGLLFQLHSDIPGEPQVKKQPQSQQKPKGSGWLKRLKSTVSQQLDSISNRVRSAWDALTGSPLDKSRA